MSRQDLRNAGSPLHKRSAPSPECDKHIESPPDATSAARRLVAAIVPRFADFAAVHVLDDGAIQERERAQPTPDLLITRRLVSVDITASRRFGALLPAGQIVRWRPDSPVLISLSRGQTIYVGHMDDSTADHLAAQLLVPGLARALPGRSLLMLPLMSNGALLGNALLVSEPGRPVHREREIAALEELGKWTATQIEQTAGQRWEHVLACQLWREAGPELPASMCGVELGYRYQPGQAYRTSRLGGDWFDAISLPGGRTALVVGDVAGHGADAAIKMSQYKTMVRTLASLDLSPDRLLHRFDLLVRRLAEEYGRYDEFLATCVYAVYDPTTRHCRIASAGHVPPILVHPDGRGELLRPISGAPIGVGGVDFESCGFNTADGSLLALYSDGLVEAGQRDIEEGIKAVAAQLTGPARALEQTCDEVLARLGASGRQDDVTLFLARLIGTRPVRFTSGSGPARPSTPDNLPVEKTSFIGRTRELDEVRRLLSSARLVTLTGTAGVGKSRTARQAAGRLRTEFPDGVRFVDLSAVNDPVLLPVAVAEAFGLTECTKDSWVDVVVGHLTDKRLLLVLDTCDHLALACANFTRSLLRAAPRVHVLATGRQPVRVTGEHTLVVPPLEPDAAVRLFVDRAASAAPGFVLSAANMQLARTLCDRLDGIPLALELAAGRLGQLSMTDLVALADDPFELLTGDRHTPSRHRSLRAAIEWSHELCEPAERVLWARLSIFAGRFDLTAVEFVCADDDLPADEMLTLVAQLVRKSIVISEKDAGTPRYSMLDAFWRYGRDRLDQRADAPAIQRRYGRN